MTLRKKFFSMFEKPIETLKRNESVIFYLHKKTALAFIQSLEKEVEENIDERDILSNRSVNREYELRNAKCGSLRCSADTRSHPPCRSGCCCGGGFGENRVSPSLDVGH